MRSYFFQTPLWLQWAYRDMTWKIETDEKVLFLTFDDGPTETATPYVLGQLKQYNAQATFFCQGSGIIENTDLLREMVHSGHGIGNHGFEHLNGWKSTDASYFEDISRCDLTLKECGVQTRLFRPPYGKISKSQVDGLKEDYELIMWSHLSGDFDQKVNIQTALHSVLKACPGSILVFHDSMQALKNLQRILPPVLDHFSNLGFTFQSLRNDTTR